MMEEECKGWEALGYEPEAGSDKDDSEDEDDDQEGVQLRDKDDDYEDSSQSGK